MTGDGSTAIINLVDDRNLTEPHKLLQQFGKLIGVDVQFFNNYNKDFHGAYENGTVYLNVNSARSLTSTFAHEIFHFLKESNSKLFEEIAKAAGITQAQLTNYLAETQRTDVKETADITEEMTADAMQEILNRVARKDKSLVERFFAWLKDTLQKFKDIFQNPKGKLTWAQYAKMADTFGKMAVKLKDADGNKIFRYNTRTHNLELANGESLESLLEDTENEIYGSEEQGFFNLGRLSLDGAKLSFAGTKALNANKLALEQARRMEKDGKSRDEIYKSTGWFKGKDNKWHFEIPDNLDKIDLSKIEETGQAVKLSNLYDNQKLFEAYPNLKDIEVSIESPLNFSTSTIGQVINRNGKFCIEFNEAVADEYNIKTALVHEIRHLIQVYELFAQGGSIQYVREQSALEIEHINKSLDQLKYDKEYEKVLAENNKSEQRRIAKLIGKENKAKIVELIDRKTKLQSFLGGNFSDRNLYNYLGGEEEARYVETRAIQNTERKLNKKSLPKPHDSFALIIFGGKEYSMASVDGISKSDLKTIREEFKEQMRALKDVPIINKATGIVAQVGKHGRSKPLSDKAIRKSLKNGYTVQQHIEAAMNIKKLFEDGVLAETHDDNNGEKNVLSIKYFHCETNVAGEKAVARIMAKEILELGHRIYTIELQELNKPAELADRTDINPSAGSKDSVQRSQIADSLSATESSNENIPQARQRNNTVTLGAGTRFSIGSSSNAKTSNNNSSEGTIGKWFSGIWDKFSRALGLKGDRIVTAETAAKRFNSEREKVMDDYIKNPSKENLKRLKDLKISKAMLDAYKNGEEYIKDVNISDVTWHSPSRVAEKVAAFRAYFRMGDKAMDKLVKLRDQFSKKFNAATDFLKSKDDNETLTNLLIDGDANEIEYGVLTEQEKNSIIASTSPENVTKQLQQARIKKICDEAGVSENVAKAYVKIRQLMTQAYHMLNDAKRRPQTLNATIKDFADGEKIYHVEVLEGIAELTNRAGYIPHLFKEYFIRVKDKDGKIVERFGLKDGEEIYIEPKIANFGNDEKNYAPIMGDKDFDD